MDEKQSETEKKAREDVTRILDSFKEQLKDFETDESIFIKREETMRNPSKEKDPEFVKRMLKNAPKHDGTSIIAEKKHW